jgi:hypothetical protein
MPLFLAELFETRWIIGEECTKNVANIAAMPVTVDIRHGQYNRPDRPPSICPRTYDVTV